MPSCINKVQLLGSLGQSPEIRRTADGAKIASFSIATSEYWTDKKTGERVSRTEWHKIVIFNERLSEVAEKYLKKGSRVLVEGQLQTRKWVDSHGSDRYTTEVVLQKFRGELILMESKEDSQSKEEIFNGNTTESYQTKLDNDYDNLKKDLDDEIPF